MTSIFSGTSTWKDIGLILVHLAAMRPLKAGNAIVRYEEAFSAYVGTKHAISFASGRMALYAILEGLGIGEGDEVILPAFTCVVVPNAILYRGATPVYVDIELQTFNMDVTQIHEKISSRTKVIIAQHTFGILCNIERIREIGNERGITVIEDCAHALGAVQGGKKAGSLADVAFFSTDHSKVMSTSSGGMVTTNDERLADRIRALQRGSQFLSTSAILRICATIIMEHIFYSPRLFSFTRFFTYLLGRFRIVYFFRDEMLISRPQAYPYPARLSNVQARIGEHQLSLLEAQITHRRKLAKAFDSVMSRFGPQLRNNDQRNVFLYYSFLVRDRKRARAIFLPEVRLNNWFNSVAHGRMAAFSLIKYREGSCPNAEFAARHIVNLPTHPRVSPLGKIITKLATLKWSDGLYDSEQNPE